MRYTSQDCATLCIHVPIREMSCPLKNSRKLRWRSDRKANAARERGLAMASLRFALEFLNGGRRAVILASLGCHHYRKKNLKCGEPQVGSEKPGLVCRDS